MIEINEDGKVVLEDVFELTLNTEKSGEALSIVMKDGGYEISYVANGVAARIELKNGSIKLDNPLGYYTPPNKSWDGG